MLAVSPASSFSIVLPNERATRRLAADVASILKAGLDRKADAIEANQPMDLLPAHHNIRGPDYYH